MISWKKLRSWFKKSDPEAVKANSSVFKKLDTRFGRIENLSYADVKQVVTALGGVEADAKSVWKDKSLFEETMTRAETILQEAERVRFEHPKTYFSDETIPVAKRAEVWVEELFKLAASVLGKKAIEWATEQMVKNYGKLQRDFQALVDKELKMSPF